MATVKPIPEDYPRVIPYLSISGAGEAIDFYKKVLGAEERMRMDAPEGKVGHAELMIGSGMVMLADEFPGMSASSATTLGGSPVTVMVYVEDVDAVFDKAVEHGATVVNKVEDQFYGDRAGTFEDPYGHRWHIATHIEDLTDEEMAKRAAAAMEG